jgi:putative DNA primase/helicase
VRGAIMWLDQDDPVRTMDRLREADPTIINLKAVLTAWRDQFGEEPTTAKDAADAADATIATREPGTLDRYVRTHTHPALRTALLLVAGRGGAIDTRVLGQWLGKHVDRVVDLGDSDFAAMEMPGMLHGDRRWKVTAKPPPATKAREKADE